MKTMYLVVKATGLKSVFCMIATAVLSVATVNGVTITAEDAFVTEGNGGLVICSHRVEMALLDTIER